MPVLFECTCGRSTAETMTSNTAAYWNETWHSRQLTFVYYDFELFERFDKTLPPTQWYLKHEMEDNNTSEQCQFVMFSDASSHPLPQAQIIDGISEYSYIDPVSNENRKICKYAFWKWTVWCVHAIIFAYGGLLLFNVMCMTHAVWLFHIYCIMVEMYLSLCPQCAAELESTQWKPNADKTILNCIWIMSSQTAFARPYPIPVCDSCLFSVETNGIYFSVDANCVRLVSVVAHGTQIGVSNGKSKRATL